MTHIADLQVVHIKPGYLRKAINLRFKLKDGDMVFMETDNDHNIDHLDPVDVLYRDLFDRIFYGRLAKRWKITGQAAQLKKLRIAYAATQI